jgi:HPt (histidine-containing phosphotransfer) domain-containing protein
MTHPIDTPTFAELQASAGAEFVAELVDTFAEEGPRLLAELGAAQAAGAAERFRRAAHALKSNGQTFGALQFAAQARALELGGLARLGPDGAEVQALADEFERALAELRTLAGAHRR